MNKAFKCSENLELFLNYLENQQKVSLSQTSGVISNFKTKKKKKYPGLNLYEVSYIFYKSLERSENF